MERLQFIGRRVRGRTAVVLGLFMLICGVVAATASAGTDTITNGSWVGPGGVYGPRHSLTRVYVHDLAGPGGSCENALNDGGGWAQAYSYCTSRGETWHDFCGCTLRYGFNHANGNYYEQMNGHQNW